MVTKREEERKAKRKAELKARRLEAKESGQRLVRLLKRYCQYVAVHGTDNGFETRDDKDLIRPCAIDCGFVEMVLTERGQRLADEPEPKPKKPR